MGTKEFTRKLELRRNGSQKKIESECLPPKLKVGRVYDFLQEGQKLYWLRGEIPLVETRREGESSDPLAEIVILDTTHFMVDNKKIYTAGRYVVKKVYDIRGENAKSS